MLELPESYTISNQIQNALTGKVISYIEILHTPHRFAFLKGDVDKYADYLEGQKIIGATWHGGMVEIVTEDSMIAFADGAYPKYYENNIICRICQCKIRAPSECEIYCKKACCNR